MIKIDTTYKIEYSKSGYTQYAEFKYNNGKLITSWIEKN